jgi:hypothetical protein
MPATKLPVVEGDRPSNDAAGPDREGAIRAGVLAALGRPAQPFRVVVVPLWGDLFRVNVVTGDDPSSVRIPHSYFVAADGRGNIIESIPSIRREYPVSP